MRQIADGAYPSAAQVVQKLIAARREAK